MVKKKKKKKQKQKKLTRKQLENLQRNLESIRDKEEGSNINPGAAIGGILFILWIIFKIAANS
tara:strand:- start:1856 stop:2044 length:189 start_codon:yes stop_codon:yes gene_type:complete